MFFRLNKSIFFIINKLLFIELIDILSHEIYANKIKNKACN